MYGLTSLDLSHALFAARDEAREERRLHGLFGMDTDGESGFLERAIAAEQRADRFQAAMYAMADATRAERMS